MLPHVEQQIRAMAERAAAEAPPLTPAQIAAVAVILADKRDAPAH